MKPVYQSDVQIGSGGEKRDLVKKVWESTGIRNMPCCARRTSPTSSLTGIPNIIFDGNKLARALTTVQRDVRVSVDLDK